MHSAAPAVDYVELTCGIAPESIEEFDAGQYLAANADVAADGMDPRLHFLTYGRQERRMQWVPQPTLPAVRDRKLARVKFRDVCPPPRPGQPVTFLTPETAAELGVPDTLPVSGHTYGGHVVQMLRDNPDKLYLDLGAGMSPRYYSNVVTTEIAPLPTTDVVCKGEDLPFESEQFDGVFCLAVLEHTLRPWEVAREICRVLKPGGRAIIDWPFLQPVHGYPHHYYNSTPEGTRRLFEAYCEVESLAPGRMQGPIFSVAWILELWRNALPADTAAVFEATRVGDLIGRGKEAQLDLPYCRDLDPKVAPMISAGTTLVAVKRAGPPITEAAASRREADERAALAAEVASLRAALAATRASTSWRITAPLRAAGRLLRGK